MPPKFTVNDVADRARRYAMLSCQAFYGLPFSPSAPRASDGFVRHFGFGVFFANSDAVTALRLFVHHVVGLSAKKQMVRVAAGRVVATVQNMKRANRTHKTLVRDSVGSFVFETPVSARVETSRPLPTAAFGNVKPGNELDRKGYVGNHKRRLAPLSVMSNV